MNIFFHIVMFYMVVKCCLTKSFTNSLTHLQPTVKLFINGKKVESQTDKFINNYNPATNEVVSRVPCATPSEMNAAFEAAQAAFPDWKAKSILSRQQIMFQFRDLIKKHWVRRGRGVAMEVWL